MNNILCGFGSVEFTPAVGLPLMGNLRDNYESTGIHDPLMATAIVFGNSSGEQAAVLSLDLCMIDRIQVSMMRKVIEEETSIPGDRVLICTTHTHAGPATMAVYTSPAAGEDEIEAFLKQACGAVLTAKNNMLPSELSVGGSNETRVSFNRRLKTVTGKTLMNWEPCKAEDIVGTLGPVDPRMTVVGIEQDGKSAALVNFPLHPAILDYENSLYSADYPGMLREGLGKIMGGDFTTLFANGCCGNLNHLNYADPSAPRRGCQAIERAGYMLAAAAAEGLDKSSPLAGSKVAVSREFVALDRFPISEETYRWSKETLAKTKGEVSSGLIDGLPEEHSAPVWIDMYEKQNEKDSVEVMVIRIGDLAVVGLPGEVFCEFGMSIREKSSARHTIVIELANDAVGYLPNEQAYGQGGYEDTPGSTKYAKGCGEKLEASALDQINRLFNKS